MSKNTLGVYYESWSCPWSSTADTLDLTNVPDPVNMILIAFCYPNCQYQQGSKSWSGTGMDFSSDFDVVVESIKRLRARGIVVMLSAGGASYSYSTYNAKGIADLAKDLGVDGIDIDMEEDNLKGQLGTIIKDIKDQNAGLVSIAAFSVGAYGTGKYSNSGPSSQYTGMCIEGLRQSGDQLDFINLMAYDAGITFNNEEAYRAYKDIYKGPVYIGQEVDPASWGGAIVNENTVTVDAQTAPGIFVWSYQKQPASGPSCMQILNIANGVYKNALIPTPAPNPPTPVIPTPVAPTPAPIPTSVKRKKSCHSSPPHMVQVPQYTPLWENGIKYNVGDKVTYNSVAYICRTSHTSQLDWTPSQYTQALWTPQAGV